MSVDDSAETIFGPLLVGLVFNIILYGAVSTQAFLYFNRTAKLDKWFIHALVTILIVAESMNSAFDVAFLYGGLVKQFAQPSAYTHVSWVFATSSALTSIISFLCQFFFTYRVAVLIPPPALGHFLTVLPIFFLAITQLVGGLGSAVQIAHHISFDSFERVELRRYVALWLGGAAGSDAMIAAVMGWHLIKHRRDFAGFGGRTDCFSRAIVQTGLFLALSVIVQLSLYFGLPAGYKLTFSLPLSKLHTATVLCALNARRGWGWGATFDAARTEDDDCGAGETFGSGLGSPRSQRSRGGRKRVPSTRIGLGRPLGMHRETIALPPIEAHELGEVGKEVQLQRVTTIEAEAWEREEAEKDMKGVAV